MDAGSSLEFKTETECIHDKTVHPRVLVVALEALGAEAAKRLPEYAGQYHHTHALYSPLCIAVGKRTQSKTPSFQRGSGQEHTNSLRLGLHLTTSHMSVKKPPLCCSDVKIRMLLLCQLISLLRLCPLPAYTVFPRKASSYSSLLVR